MRVKQHPGSVLNSPANSLPAKSRSLPKPISFPDARLKAARLTEWICWRFSVIVGRIQDQNKKFSLTAGKGHEDFGRY
jgi:hypothetical protein